jgi:hypothetical protein
VSSVETKRMVMTAFLSLVSLAIGVATRCNLA